MKRIAIIIIVVFWGIAANAQTALYKKFTSCTDLHVYCVEHYPLASGDSVAVTLFVADDSTAYRSILQEFHALPHNVRSNGRKIASSLKGKGRVSVVRKTSVEKVLQEQKAENRKNIIGFTTDALPEDKGYYMFYCPSDRMVILSFLCLNEDDLIKVTAHMIDTEF